MTEQTFTGNVSFLPKGEEIGGILPGRCKGVRRILVGEVYAMPLFRETSLSGKGGRGSVVSEG